MSMRPRGSVQIPAETVAAVQAACPKGTRVTRVRDALGPMFADADFAGWFAAEGRASTAPAVLALVCVLQSMEDLADRDAAEAVRTRLDWKYALGLTINDEGFDFSVLSEFRDRLAADDRAMELLEAMLGAASEAGLLRRGGRSRTDSTHVLGNIRRLNRLELVGETARLALEQVAELAPGWLGPRIQPGWQRRYARRIESFRLPPGEAARAGWADQVAADGAFLLDAIDGDPDGAWLGNLPTVKALAQVWAQQCARGEDLVWRFRKECLLAGAERVDTPHDVQVRWSAKRSTQWSGYKVHLTETCDEDTPHLLTHVQTTMATDTDLAALPDIHDGLATRNATPGEHYVDTGYVTVEAIVAAAQSEITIIGPVLQDSSWQAKAGRGFDRASFTIDWDTRTATCPTGKTNISWHDQAQPHGNGAAIRFADADCAACPMRAQCTRSVAGRQITIPPRALHELQLANRADQRDPGWQRRYDRRAGVEGTISEAVRANGLRRCRYQGLAKTRVQHVLIACGMNAARIADWRERGDQPARPRPQSRLKTLCAQVATKSQQTDAGS